LIDVIVFVLRDGGEAVVGVGAVDEEDAPEDEPDGDDAAVDVI
jgi:hypothetical protein